MKRRMQITISEDVRKKLEHAKDFYGGYSRLIEKAVVEFLSRPVEPYEEDILDAERSKRSNEWIGLDELREKIRR